MRCTIGGGTRRDNERVTDRALGDAGRGWGGTKRRPETPTGGPGRTVRKGCDST